MADQAHEPEQSPPATPGFAWIAGSSSTGPVPEGPVLDGQALLEALAAGGFLDGEPDDQDAAVAEEQAAAADGRMSGPLPAGQAGALAVEHMPPGPAQAGWLAAAAAQATSLDEYELAGVATAARQLASWAAAVELTAVAHITSRTAAVDPDIGLKPDGRPAKLCRDAVGQVSLALMLTDYAATDLAGLAVTLAWRLPATGAALSDGRIDLLRAKVIAEATGALTEHAARAVEAQVLPGAGRQTTARLRARLRRAVLAADPDGAEQRRQDAERQARVCLYSDSDGTATLAGMGLPAVAAAAAMARITAIARAMKAAGHGGGLDLHRAQVLLGLLLGTLPHIPPADGAPEPPPPDDSGDPGGNGGGDSGGPGDSDDPGGNGDSDDLGEPGGGDSSGPSDSGDPGGPGGDDPGPGHDPGPPDEEPRGPGGSDSRPGTLPPGPPDDRPPPRDEDAPADDGLDHDTADTPDHEYGHDDDDRPGAGPTPPWPDLGAIPPALARPAPPADGRPPPGLLDLTLPWATLAGLSNAPGTLGRIGPITATQARHLATAAATDPAAQWRIIITNPAGQAITVTRIPRRTQGTRVGQARAGPGPPGPAAPPLSTGLTGRITLTITTDTIRQHTTQPRPPSGPSPAADPSPAAGIADAALRAAARALDRAQAQAAADTAAGGCAHTSQSDGYRPPPRLRERITARDLTCRYPACRQPAWRADLDHTVPWDQGGRTCACNLGGACRRHHQLKQHPRWKLEQTRPGEFTWTTPAGRTYTVSPDTHPV
jgi:Domain of unknown function (DUF222)